MTTDGKWFLFGSDKPIPDSHVQELGRLGLMVNIDNKTEQQAL